MSCLASFCVKLHSWVVNALSHPSGLQVRSLQLSLDSLEQCLDGADLGRQLAALEVRRR